MSIINTRSNTTYEVIIVYIYHALTISKINDGLYFNNSETTNSNFV